MLLTYLVYNTILVFVLLGGYCVQKAKNNVSELSARTFTFLVMAIPAAIRKGIGTDYWSYVGLYRIYATGADEHEWGFQLLGRLLNMLGLHYQWFIICLAIFALIPICYYIPKKIFAGFIVFYFLLEYIHIISTGRQDISIALFSCGIIALYRRRGTIKYLICVLAAFLMHYSSILYLPLILLKKIKFTPVKAYICLAGVILATSGAGIIEWVFENPLFLDSPYGEYAVNENYNVEAHVGSGLGIIANMIVPFLFILLNDKIPKEDGYIHFLTTLSLCYIGSYLLASQIHIFGRLMSVFTTTPAFLILPLSKAISFKYQKLVRIVIFFIYLIVFERFISISRISLGSGLGISPYMTVFD